MRYVPFLSPEPLVKLGQPLGRSAHILRGHGVLLLTAA